MAENEEPKIMIHIDPIDKDKDLPEYDDSVKCPDHPNEQAEQGMGLAGGGFGVYNYCPICFKILSKSTFEDGE